MKAEMLDTSEYTPTVTLTPESGFEARGVREFCDMRKDNGPQEIIVRASYIEGVFRLVYVGAAPHG